MPEYKIKGTHTHESASAKIFSNSADLIEDPTSFLSRMFISNYPVQIMI